jgi:hypothetical protein
MTFGTSVRMVHVTQLTPGSEWQAYALVVPHADWHRAAVRGGHRGGALHVGIKLTHNP